MKILEQKSFFKFKKEYENFNVNVNKGARTVHKKDGCHNSEPYQFIPFKTLNDIKEFEKEYSIQFTYCQDPKCEFNK